MKDVAYPLYTNPDRWSILNSVIEYRAGDIIIASYPKCGTTWTEQCILLLLNDGYPDRLNPATKNVYVPNLPDKTGKIWLEAALMQDDPVFAQLMGSQANPISLQEFEEMPDRRVIKTHAPINLLLGQNEICFVQLRSYYLIFVCQ